MTNVMAYRFSSL